jgi:hypothetical protein
VTSPYENQPISNWLNITKKIIRRHPLSTKEIVQITLDAWKSIFDSKVGNIFLIGKDIFPKPQIMGFFLHELIPLTLAKRYPDKWRKEETAAEKDLIYIPDDTFSVEIKTSSSAKNIYGNRSYAQEANSVKKSKSGYYLAINFQNFSAKISKPQITRVRFGWLDHADWIGQTAATGQQARLSPDVEQKKLIILYDLK